LPIVPLSMPIAPNTRRIIVQLINKSEALAVPQNRHRRRQQNNADDSKILEDSWR